MKEKVKDLKQELKEKITSFVKDYDIKNFSVYINS